MLLYLCYSQSTYVRLSSLKSQGSKAPMDDTGDTRSTEVSRGHKRLITDYVHAIYIYIYIYIYLFIYLNLPFNMKTR
jgi:hypothetical protein